MICIFMILGKGLVSKDAASCTPGVKCFFVHYWNRLVLVFSFLFKLCSTHFRGFSARKYGCLLGLTSSFAFRFLHQTILRKTPKFYNAGLAGFTQQCTNFISSAEKFVRKALFKQ